MENLIRDARYGLRLLARSPIFTTVAVLSLALGIGANAAIFHLVDALTLRSLAVVNPHELIEVRPNGPQAFGTYDGTNSKATYLLWEQIRANQTALSATFAWGDGEFVVGRGANARPARGLWVSGDFFPVLGIPPHRGRLFGPADDRRGCGAASAVVSHAFWQSHLGGRGSAIGTTFNAAGSAFYYRRYHAAVVHRSGSGPEIRYCTAAVRCCALGLSHRPPGSVVADDNGPARAGLDDCTGE